MHSWNPMFVMTRLIVIGVIGYGLCRIFGVRRLGRLFWAPIRLMRFLALVVLVGLAGCANNERLAVAVGPTFALNPDHWQATAADLAAPNGGK